jgi:ACS family glucarate transporter-like MFS transporter
MRASAEISGRSTRLVEAGMVALMVGFSVMSYFDRTIMSIAGPKIIKEFSLSATQMGWVYSAFILSYAVLMIPGGRLTDRFGPWRVLTLMGLGAGLFTGLTALGGKTGLGTLVGVFPALIILRLGFGVSTAPIYPSCGRMNANWFPVSRRARVWGLVAAGAGVGSATSPLLFSWMMGRFGWRLSSVLAGAATATLALLWLFYARDYPSEHPALRPQNIPASATENAVEGMRSSVRTPWGRLLTDRNLMLLTAGYFTVAYFEYIFFFWIYYYFQEVRHMGQQQSAVYTTAPFVAWMVMTPLGGWASDRISERWGRKIGRRIVPIACLTLGAALLCLGINLSDPVAVTVVLSFSLGFASCSDGPYWASAIDVGGKHVGAAGGILNTGGNLGGFVAPVLTPFIAARAGWSWGLYFGSFVMMAGVVAWFFTDPTRAVGEGEGVPVRPGPAGAETITGPLKKKGVEL